MKLYNIIAALGFCIGITACQSSQQAPLQDTTVSLNTLHQKVKTMEIQENYVVYEYSDVRIDEVSLLATLYCQSKNNQKAYLDKVNLYKNNLRRATFYCYK